MRLFFYYPEIKRQTKTHRHLSFVKEFLLFKLRQKSLRYYLFLSGFLLTSCHTASAPLQEEREFPSQDFKTGDLVLRCGRSFSSKVVLLCEQRPLYSHIGFLIKEGGRCFVIHAAPDEKDETGKYNKVIKEPLSDFWQKKRCSKGGIYRTPFGTDTLSILAFKALRLAEEQRPFDHRFEECDTNALYCTELIHVLFYTTGIDLTQGKRTRVNLPFTDCLILPSHILSYPRIKAVYTFSDNE